jgi:hypothetical protein
MEMKRKHAMEGRYDEPSLAGLFMGANALVCKPMKSILLPNFTALCSTKATSCMTNKICLPPGPSATRMFLSAATGMETIRSDSEAGGQDAGRAQETGPW